MDRIERAIEHLLEVQARYETRSDNWERHFEVIDARLDRITAVQDRHERDFDGLMEIVQRNSEAHAKVARDIDGLREAMQRNADAQRDTDERLNALIKVVDDLVRQKPPGAS